MANVIGVLDGAAFTFTLGTNLGAECPCIEPRSTVVLVGLSGRAPRMAECD